MPVKLPTSSPGPSSGALLWLSRVSSLNTPPQHPQRRSACGLGGRTFQELAEVKVVLHDHMWDHLLVKAQDLEQSGLQKNGFCII